MYAGEISRLEKAPRPQEPECEQRAKQIELRHGPTNPVFHRRMRLGAVLVARSGRGVCAILLGDDPTSSSATCAGGSRMTIFTRDAGLEPLLPRWRIPGNAPTGLDAAAGPAGVRAEQRVWSALREIPPGTTEAYS